MISTEVHAAYVIIALYESIRLAHGDSLNTEYSGDIRRLGDSVQALPCGYVYVCGNKIELLVNGMNIKRCSEKLKIELERRHGHEEWVFFAAKLFLRKEGGDCIATLVYAIETDA